MTEMKVLGIGSPFGDDRVGWDVMEKLRKRSAIQRYDSSLLIMESYDRPNVRLLEYMSDAKTVILIDAVIAGKPVGSLYRLQNTEIEECKYLVSTHDFGLAQAMQLGRALKSLPENIILFGMEIDRHHAGERLSPVVEDSLTRLIECIEAEIVLELG